jgi:zinc protease
MPAIWRGELENGVAVLGANNAETPTTAIRLNIEAGQRHEPLEKLGLASITAAMLSESTTESSNEEISNRLQKLGSSVNFGAGDTQTTMTLRSLSENLDETLEIAAEMLLQPKFDPADFERVRSQLLQLIEHNKKEASVTARQTLDDVKAFYAEHYSPRIAEIIAVSDYSQSELLQKLSVLETWRGAEVAEAELQDFPDLGKTKIYLVDKPGAAQSEVRIGKRAMKYDATGEYYRAGLMNFALGGAFNSRINLNLREDKAYTYGARSFFSGNKDFGAYTASGAIRTDATADSIVQFENEIRGYADGGISEDELLFTRRALGQRDARRYETPSQKLGFLSRILEYGLDVDFVDQQNEILESIGAEELNELAQKHLTMDDMVIVIVGDKDVILPQIEELGYDIVELDAEGNELPI